MTEENYLRPSLEGFQVRRTSPRKKSFKEQILHSPELVIGSIEPVSQQIKETALAFDSLIGKIVQRPISFSPGLYSVLDRLLVSAAVENEVDMVKIELEDGKMSVWSNAKGIPAEIHEEENLYLPTMIFDNLINYAKPREEEEKLIGGREFQDVRVSNVFSKKFSVETVCQKSGTKFVQTWENNSSTASAPEITHSNLDDYIHIQIEPDFEKFQVEKFDQDLKDLLSRRAFEISATTDVQVELNNEILPIDSFKDFISLVLQSCVKKSGKPIQVTHKKANESWEVACCKSDETGFRQNSFANGFATTKGGKHVDCVTNNICKHIKQVLLSKGVDVKLLDIKSQMWVFINCFVSNPTFDSQIRDKLTLKVDCQLSDAFLNQLVKDSGIIEAVLEALQPPAPTNTKRQHIGSSGAEEPASKKKKCLLIPEIVLPPRRASLQKLEPLQSKVSQSQIPLPAMNRVRKRRLFQPSSSTLLEEDEGEFEAEKENARLLELTIDFTKIPQFNTKKPKLFTFKAKRRFRINLHQNKSQELEEHYDQLQKRPHSPHDPEREPEFGVLKNSKTPIPLEKRITKYLSGLQQNELFKF